MKRQSMNLVISKVMANKHYNNCVLSRRKNYIFVRGETLKINFEYARDKINILLVYESPPWASLRARRIEL